MKLDVFQFLCSGLKNKGGLKVSQYGTTFEEQVAMFLFTRTWSASNCDVQERFQHSSAIVARYFHAAIGRLVSEYIEFTSTSDIPTVITITIGMHCFNCAKCSPQNS